MPTSRAGYRLDTVLTVVDALHGEAALDRHPEARRQAALADRLALSKTDVAGPGEALRHRLAALNPTAPIAADSLRRTPDWLFSTARYSGAGGAFWPRCRPRGPPPSRRYRPNTATVSRASCCNASKPLPALALTLLLQALAEHCGARLLRVKGLVDVAEMPGQPALIHGVQHVFAPPEFLPRWPSETAPPGWCSSRRACRRISRPGCWRRSRAEVAEESAAAVERLFDPRLSAAHGLSGVTDEPGRYVSISRPAPSKKFCTYCGKYSTWVSAVRPK